MCRSVRLISNWSDTIHLQPTRFNLIFAPAHEPYVDVFFGHKQQLIVFNQFKLIMLIKSCFLKDVFNK